MTPRPFAVALAIILFAPAALAQCPSQATVLTAQSDACTTTVTWSAASNVDDYLLYRSATTDFADASLVAVRTVTNYIDTPPLNGTYTYWVQGRRNPAACASNTGPLSAPFTAAGPSLPPPPTNPSVFPLCRQVHVSWDAAPRAASYRVIAKDADGNVVANVTTTGTAADIPYSSGPVPASYTVSSRAPCGESAGATATGSPTTEGGNPPQSVSATDGACNNVVVTWTDAPGPGATGYLLRITSPGRATRDVQLPVTARSYTDSAQLNALYTYTLYGTTICGIGEGVADTGFRALPLTQAATPVVAPRASTAVLTAPFVSEGSGLTYAWRKGAAADGTGGTPIADGGRISGATTARLTITNVQPEDAALYGVTVSACASASTAAAVALVVPTTCRPDYNGTNGADLLDIFAFLSDWFAGCP